MRNTLKYYENKVAFEPKYGKRLGDAVFSILIFPFSFAS